MMDTEQAHLQGIVTGIFVGAWVILFLLAAAGGLVVPAVVVSAVLGVLILVNRD